MQMWRFPETERLVEIFLDDLDSQTRRVGHGEVACGECEFRTEDLVIAVPIDIVGIDPGFEPAEIGRGRGHVDRGDGTDRAERVVRHHVDIVRLGPADDLHRLSKATHIA